MGAWFQNIGLALATPPERLIALAADEPIWIDDPPADGWSWVTLRDMIGNDEEFGELAEALARDCQVAAVGFGVFDETSAYLVVASPAGIEARLVFHRSAYESLFDGIGEDPPRFPDDGAEAFARWTERFAKESVTAARVREFCEVPDGDPTWLLIEAGIYPTPPPSDRPHWMDWRPRDFAAAGPLSWDGGGHSHLTGDRQYALLPEPPNNRDKPPGTWMLLVAHDEIQRHVPMEAYLICPAKDRCFGLRGRFATHERWIQHFRGKYEGREIVVWQPVPEGVGRSLADTVRWLVSQAPENDASGGG